MMHTARAVNAKVLLLAQTVNFQDVNSNGVKLITFDFMAYPR